jgi:hypothetical protein
MIQSRPKPSTFFALGIIVLAQIGGLIYILNHFATKRTFSVIIYLIVTVFLTLIIVLLLVKMMAAYKFIAIGNEKIITKNPLHGRKSTYSFAQVVVWEEESVVTNKREFKQLTIVFDDKSSFTISNHEHLNFDEFSKYLHKKLIKKKIIPGKKPKNIQGLP